MANDNATIPSVEIVDVCNQVIAALKNAHTLMEGDIFTAATAIIDGAKAKPNRATSDFYAAIAVKLEKTVPDVKSLRMKIEKLAETSG